MMKSEPYVNPVATELIFGAKMDDNALAASHVNAFVYAVKIECGEGQGSLHRVVFCT